MYYILERWTKQDYNGKLDVIAERLKLDLEDFSEVFRVGEVIDVLGDVTLDKWNRAKKYADKKDGIVLYTNRYSTRSMLDGEMVLEYVMKNTEGPEEKETEEDDWI